MSRHAAEVDFPLCIQENGGFVCIRRSRADELEIPLTGNMDEG